jgi:hypothetical protein
LYEESSEVEGSLRSLKSVAELDKEKMVSIEARKAEKRLDFLFVALAGTKRSFVSVTEIEKRLKNVRVANNF